MRLYPCLLAPHVHAAHVTAPLSSASTHACDACGLQDYYRVVYADESGFKRFHAEVTKDPNATVRLCTKCTTALLSRLVRCMRFNAPPFIS
jgi:hypothetical protein